MSHVIEREKLRDQVAHRLKEMLWNENLKPGDRLPTEAQLAERFGVSRLSLREATKSLEFLGVIRSKPGLGLSVGSVDMSRVIDYIGFHPALQNVSPEVLLETRVVIETGALPNLVKRMRRDAAIEMRLFALADEMRRRMSDLDQWIDLDIEFHRALLQESGLVALMPFSDLVSSFFKKYRQYNGGMAEVTQMVERSTKEHDVLIKALSKNQLEDAARILAGHIRVWRKRLSLPELQLSHA